MINREKGRCLSAFFSSVFTIEPDGDISRIPPVKLRHTMDELTIDEDTIKKTCV